jgi:hypothetical protein
MHCHLCQNELLSSARPDQPSPEVSHHLAECPACQEWHRQLLRIEANVPRIPVPASNARDRLLRIIRNVDPAPVPIRRLSVRPSRWRMPAMGAAGLVAAAVLIACGIFLGNFLSHSLRQPGPPEQAVKPQPKPAAKNPAGDAELPGGPLLARLLNCDVNLAEADTSRQRVEALAALADELKEETRALARVAAKDDLQGLARLYEKVIADGVVAHARNLPMSERRPILGPIADRLRQTQHDLQKMAQGSRPASAEPLQQIAAAAQSADGRLRDLMQEATP